MAKKDGMTDRQLLSIIAQHEQSAMGGSSPATNMATAGTTTNYGTLDVERATALDYYHGRPLGNEQADRSQVVSQDFRDTVEWIKPQVLRMFIDADEMFRFDPTGPEDEPLAEQESDAVNYVFMKQNNGVLILHDMLTDSLILKNGYVKVWYEEEECEEFSTYTGLDVGMLTYTITQIEQSGAQAEIVAAEKTEGFTVDPQTGQQVPNVTYDVRIKAITKRGKCNVECVATEDMLVSPKTRGDLQKSPFVAQRIRKSRSSLKELGYIEDDEDISSDDFPRTDIQDIARSDTVDELGADGRTNDRSMDDIECLECYLRIDFDGDGYAELRKILRAGNQVLSNDPIEEIPFAYAVPVRMPHRHIGISLYDLTKDIQDIKTTLIRQALDNTYLVNNGRFVINDQVNVQDMVSGRPGGVVRTTGDATTAVVPIVTQPIASDILGMVNYVDSMVAQRTGISATTQGLDPDTLQETTAKAYNNAMNAATAKIELMARIFAEGVKQIGLLIHGCLVRHQDKPMMMKLRNQWVPVDPSSWKTRYGVTVNVGLGTGTRDEQRQNLMLLGQMQQAAAQAGIVLPPNVYALVTEMSKALGIKAPERFFTDPASPQYQQHMQQQQQQPDPRIQAAQITAQAGVKKAQIQAQGDVQSIQAEQQMHERDLQMKAQMEDRKFATELAKARMSHNADMVATAQQTQMKHTETLSKLVMNRENNQSKEHQAFLNALAAASGGNNGRD